MTAKAIFCRVLAVSTCCLLLTACGSKDPEASAQPTQPTEAPVQPAPQPEKQGGVKVDPKAGTKSGAKAAPASKQSASAKSAPLTDEELHQGLKAFALKTVGEMNRYALPSKQKKEVVKNPDGSFTARYVEVDPDSIRTSFKKPESSSAVSYVGYLTYEEGVYVCKAGSKDAAEAGPFTCQQRTAMTELIKYTPKNGWSY